MYDQKKKKTKMDIFASYKADITQATGYKEHCRETLFAREYRKNLSLVQWHR